MKSTLRYRQVHLDFHTSEHIEGVGAAFEPEHFARTLKRAHVDSVTVFARCHHGWCYYPTRIGTPHPQLARPDLLGEMVTACRKHDINVPVYITVQWDELTARRRPDWRVMKADNRAVHPRADDLSAGNQLTATWHTLCLNNDEYIDYVIALAREVMELYDPDGLFMDIVGKGNCVCPRCVAAMEKAGLNAENPGDRSRHDQQVLMHYYRRFTEAIWSTDPGMRIFHNSGHVLRGRRERYRYFSHLELESLPTGGWGYDHFPVSARYVHTLGMEYLGMTGKFHTMWGEFGGYKRSEALDYECALMAALGARCSIGDQLPPSGAIDEATYERIEPAYARVELLEPYLEGARSAAEIAVLSSEAVNGAEGRAAGGDAPGGANPRSSRPDDGAARMLLELHRMFDVIDAEADFSRYRLMVLPDDVRLGPELAGKLQRYIDAGGSLILSGSSGMTPDASAFALEVNLRYGGGRRQAAPDYLSVVDGFAPDFPSGPVVMYARPYLVGPGARGPLSPGGMPAGGRGGEPPGRMPDHGPGGAAPRHTAGEGPLVLARSHEPYLDRSWRHFCSHQHFPPRPEPSVERAAVIQDAGVIYFAHPVFEAYVTSGQPMYRDLVSSAIERLVSTPLLRVEMPGAGRVSLMRQTNPERLLLHLLYAQPQLRGRGHVMSNGQKLDVEILEDIVPVYDVSCSVRMDRKPARVYLAGSGGSPDSNTGPAAGADQGRSTSLGRGAASASGAETDIDYSHAEGYVRFTVPKVHIHRLVVIELPQSA